MRSSSIGTESRDSFENQVKDLEKSDERKEVINSERDKRSDSFEAKIKNVREFKAYKFAEEKEAKCRI